MDMRKSRLILAGILIPVLSIFAGENSMCRRDAATGALNIDNGCFSFTLFPGYMFPVWVKNCDGKPLPGCRFLDRITFLKLVQFSNALVSNFVTVFGMVTFCNEVHPLNAASLIVVTVVFQLIVVKSVQFSNASAPI